MSFVELFEIQTKIDACPDCENKLLVCPSVCACQLFSLWASPFPLREPIGFPCFLVGKPPNKEPKTFAAGCRQRTLPKVALKEVTQPRFPGMQAFLWPVPTHFPLKKNAKGADTKNATHKIKRISHACMDVSEVRRCYEGLPRFVSACCQGQHSHQPSPQAVRQDEAVDARSC